jgi:hypothetical protein
MRKKKKKFKARAAGITKLTNIVAGGALLNQVTRVAMPREGAAQSIQTD